LGRFSLFDSSAGRLETRGERNGMKICELCAAQSKKTHNGKPHEDLMEMDAPRIFGGKPPRGFTEQDYKCLSCESRFTWSTSRTDLAWTLWRR